MPSTSDTPLLLTAEEAARLLGIGRTKMFKLIGGGDVESVTIGRHRRVPTEALKDYVQRLRTDRPEAAA